jgi:hypothetical protein
MLHRIGSAAAPLSLSYKNGRVWDGTPDAHGSDVQGDHVHSSIRARFVAAEKGVKVESPQRSEENRP